mgnify:CR=1 FL=1
MHPGRSCDVFSRTLLRGIVENPNTFVYAESRVFPGQEVPSEVFVQEFAVHQKRDDPTPEDLDHRLEPREWDEKERTFVIEPAFQNDGVEVRVPPEHIPNRLMRYDHAGMQRSARRLSVELIDNAVAGKGLHG